MNPQEYEQILSQIVQSESVLTFFGRIYDIKPTFNGQVHGVLVAMEGFQPGVEVLAEHLNIDLQPVRSPSEFGFAYKKLLLIQPASATTRTSTSGPVVVISETK